MRAKGRFLVACAIGIALVPTVPVTAQVPPLAVRPARTVVEAEPARPAAVAVSVRETSEVRFTLRGPAARQSILTQTVEVDGSYRFVWSGTDVDGESVAPGTYVLEIDCSCGGARLVETVELQVARPPGGSGGSGKPKDPGGNGSVVAPPSDLLVVAAQDNTLTWTASGTDGIGAYRVYRSSSPGGAYQLLGETAETTFVDLPAEKGIYWYQVTAVVPKGKGKESAPTEPVSSDDVYLAQEVGPAGGTLSPTTGTVELVVPAGALDATLTVTIDQITPPPTRVNRAVVTRVFEFGPAGTRFETPATLRLKYEIPDELRLPSGYPEDVTFMQIWNPSTQRWTGVTGETVDLATETITAPLNHFTILAAGATTDPHGGYSSETNLCGLCHLVHQAPGPNLHPYATEKETCYQCHDGTGANADIRSDFGEATIGSSTKASYHPVPAPVDGYSVTCSGCHTPHRLKTDFTRLLRSWDGTTLDPDGFPLYLYSTAASPIGNAFCYSCHTNAASVSATFPDTDFDNSAHAGVADPPAAPVFPEGTGATSGIKCLGCHEQHASDQTKLTLNGKPQETLCYDCHTGATNSSGGTNPPWTAAAGPFPGSDVFAAFNAASNVYTPGAVRIYHHPVSDAEQAGGTRKVECVSCHNPHLADQTDGATTSKAANPADVWQKWLFGWDFTSGYLSRGSNADGFCLTCHQNGATTAPLNAGPGVPYDVRLVDDGASHEQFSAADWAISNHGNATFTLDTYNGCDAAGVLRADCVVTCTNCHDPHGSSNPFTLRERVIPPDWVAFTVTEASYAAPKGGGGGPGEVTLTYTTPSGLACAGRNGPGCTVAGGVQLTLTGVTGIADGTYTTTNDMGGPASNPITFDYAGGTADFTNACTGTCTAAPPQFGVMTGWDGSSAAVRAWCLTCHIERGTEHKSGACTNCHTHEASSAGSATQL